MGDDRARLVAFLGAVIAAGAILRLIPCFGDFWLDEIWSYYYARELTSPIEVFTNVHHSNNHHLPMLWLYALGDVPYWVYRIPSLLAGIGSVALAAYLGWRRGRVEAVFVTVLFGFSFLLVAYSSEARGYACALFFALLSWVALDLYLARGGWRHGVWFVTAVVLGYLSQLVFLLFYASLMIWGIARVFGRRRAMPDPGGARLDSLLAWQAIPIAAFLALYWVDLRHMEVGSGESLAWTVVAGQTIGHLFGTPAALGGLQAGCALLLLTLGIRLLARRGDDSWILVLAGTIAPVLVIALARPDVVAPRYFILAGALLLWIAGLLLASLYRRGGIARAASLGAMALFLAGHGSYLAGFLEHGRGGYHEAMRYMAAHTRGPQLVVGLDHEFRTGIVLRFYARSVPEKEILVATDESWPAEGPEWFVAHRPENPDHVAAQVADRFGNAYRLEAAYPFAGLSGFHWALYRSLRDVPESQIE